MRRLLIVLLAAQLAGCSALMIGGNSTGGYESGGDERSTSQATVDTGITTRIKAKYAVDPVVKMFTVGVSTYAGKVTLSGTVGSYAAREQAEKLAMQTDGVRAVDNQIRVQGAQ